MKLLHNILNLIDNNKKTAIILLVIVNLLVLSVNYNQKDTATLIGPHSTPGYNPDMKGYVLLTLYFRGENDGKELENPYTYRPLAPLIAAQIKFLSAPDALNLVNIFLSFLILLYLYKLQIKLNLSFNFALFGCFLYSLSFPNLYYTTVCRIDPMLIFFITFGLYLILKENNYLMILLYLLGGAVKESLIILPIIHLSYLYFAKKINLKSILPLIINIAVFIVSSLFVRKQMNFGSFYLWSPGWKTINENIYRKNTYITFVLTYFHFGIINILNLKFIKQFSNFEKSLYIGVFLSVCLYLYSIIGAYTDGRFIWTAYPFAIPLVMIYLSRIIQSKEIPLSA